VFKPFSARSTAPFNCIHTAPSCSRRR
jgi:hypothetical protein